MEAITTKHAASIETKLQELFTAMSQFLLDPNQTNDDSKLMLYNSLTKFEMQCDALFLFLQNHYRQLLIEKRKSDLHSNDSGVGFSEYIERQEAADALLELLGPHLAAARAKKL